MMFLCRMGRRAKQESRSSAFFWFSTVQPTITLSYPSPQSGGTQSMNRPMRLVRNRNRKSLRSRMMSQHASRQASASSIRKSVWKHRYTICPPAILYSPLFLRAIGASNLSLRTMLSVSTPRLASPL